MAGLFTELLNDELNEILDQVSAFNFMKEEAFVCCFL